MVTFDRWQVREMPRDPHHLALLWSRLESYPILFSDETRGDIQSWISSVTHEGTIWLEVLEGSEVIGIIRVILEGDDADCHITFFDRKPAEKKELCKAVIVQLFKTLPQLERISAAVPDIYPATWRLAMKVGFKWEGTKRKAVTIGGQRRDLHLYGMLRSEV